MDRDERTKREEAESLDKARKQKAGDAYRAMVLQVGPRYAVCRLSNFSLSSDSIAANRQSNVIGSLETYIESFHENVREGRGIVFYGPPGTGKDHLLCAMLNAAARYTHTVKWIDGMNLFGSFRDAMDTPQSEADLLAEYTKADILAISDPIPPWGELTQFQAATLFRLIDRRYRDRRPTWVTANFADGSDAATRIGSQVIDRLKDGALVLHCNWPSYRQPGATDGGGKENDGS